MIPTLFNRKSNPHNNLSANPLALKMVYPCRFGGNGNGINITVNLTLQPSHFEVQREQLYTYINAIQSVHLDPAKISKQDVKEMVDYVIGMSRLVDEESKILLFSGVTQFFQAIVDSIDVQMVEVGKPGFDNYQRRAAYTHNVICMINHIFRKNNLTTDQIEVGKKLVITNEPPQSHFSNPSLFYFLTSISHDVESYQRWEHWSKTTSACELSNYLDQISREIVILENWQVKQIGKQIISFCNELALRSQHLSVISMLYDIGSTCTSQSPVRVSPRPNEEHVLKGRIDMLVNDPQFEENFRNFKTYLGGILKNNRPRQQEIMWTLKNHTEMFSEASHHGKILKTYIERTYNHTQALIPADIHTEIQAMRRDYETSSSVRDKTKLQYLLRLEEVIKENPHRSPPSWFKLTRDSFGPGTPVYALLSESHPAGFFMIKRQFNDFIHALQHPDPAVHP